MKAYNEQWIYNRQILEQAERWHRQGFLSDAQIEVVRQSYPVGFRQTNGFIEIGLFLFTTVAILACYLLPSSVFSSMLDNQTAYSFFNLAFGLGVGVVGRILIGRRLLYRNGIDNAFVVTQTGFLAFGLNQFLPNGLSVATHCLATLPLLVLVLWYYGDTLIAFFTIATFYTLVFDQLIKFGWGKDAFPWVMMATSVGIYLVVRQVIRNQSRQGYYTDPLNLMQWISLLILAASGNYYMVRELHGILIRPNFIASRHVVAPEISLAGLFWLLTFVIPAIYLWQGLTKKNRTLIILGILGSIAAVMTLYKYTHWVALNVALTIGGLLLIGIATICIRLLRQPSYGFTDTPDDDSPSEFLSNMNTLASMQAATTAHQTPKNDLRFGGGNFGGAGSGETY